MEYKLRSAFDMVQMSDSCIGKIEKAMTKKAARRSPSRRIKQAAAAAACLTVVLLAGTNPTVVQALERILKPFTQGTVYIDNRQYSYNDGNLMISGTHNWVIDSREVLGETPDWQWLSAPIKEGKLFFTANGEMIDITDLISYDTPFTYIYTDDTGIIHYIAVGGEFTAQSGLGNVGKVEFLRYADAVEEDAEMIHAGWMGGYSDNYCDEQGQTYPWVIKAYEILGLPWSPPGD